MRGVPINPWWSVCGELSFQPTEEFLPPDIRLFQNGQKSPDSNLRMVRDGHEPPGLFVPQMDVASGLAYWPKAEKSEGSRHFMS